MMAWRAGYKCNQPLRKVCPRCAKKGVGIWHVFSEHQTRDRACRYCGYTEMQTFVISDFSYSGEWQQTESDTQRMASYNGK